MVRVRVAPRNMTSSDVIPNGVIGSDARLELHHDRELLAPRSDRVAETVVVAAVAPVGVGVGVGMGVGVGL